MEEKREKDPNRTAPLVKEKARTKKERVPEQSLLRKSSTCNYSPISTTYSNDI